MMASCTVVDTVRYADATPSRVHRCIFSILLLYFRPSHLVSWTPCPWRHSCRVHDLHCRASFTETVQCFARPPLLSNSVFSLARIRESYFLLMVFTEHQRTADSSIRLLFHFVCGLYTKLNDFFTT